MWNAMSYYWTVSRGYRWHPWDSPYLRWRLETFLGPEAQNLGPFKFMKILWKYRHETQSFMDWAADRRRYQRRSRVRYS